MNLHSGMTVKPTPQNNWIKIADNPTERTHRARTENIGRKIKSNDPDTPGTFKIVSASNHFYVGDNGKYRTCFGYEDKTWEFVG